MKFFACIFSLYLLSLSIVPCVDEAMGNALHQIEFSSDTTGNLPNDFDECSPFCTCNCCVSPVVILQYYIQFDCFYFIQNHPTEYSQNYFSTIGSAIWQPPHLSYYIIYFLLLLS
ncbi:MAG: hypothetical protein Q8N05_20965 [Bacteroidota bacterium]|nr:hypothetical protein [Bacteroidota bacterium]